jgi:hypothetical protein
VRKPGFQGLRLFPRGRWSNRKNRRPKKQVGATNYLLLTSPLSKLLLARKLAHYFIHGAIDAERRPASRLE